MPGVKIQDASGLRQAAVAMILKPDLLLEELTMLLIKRKVRSDDLWSGHIAFPGGHQAVTDDGTLSTAVREVFEETNIDLRSCSIVGMLDEVIPQTLGSVKVTPFVAIAPRSIEVKINEREVSEFFWIPISFFHNTENLKPYEITRLGQTRRFSAYYYRENYVIWGMTERMIEDFIQKIRE